MHIDQDTAFASKTSNVDQSQTATQIPELPLHALSEAASLAGCQVRDLLNLANEKKFVLLTAIPDGVDMRVYDESTKQSRSPFLMSPELLVLRHSYCMKIALNGRTEQSDFSDGYLIDSCGKLKQLSPNYGYPDLDHIWVYWKTCIGNLVRSIDLTPERIFIMHDDLIQLISSAAWKNKTVITKANEDRRTRLQKRKTELLSQGITNFNLTISREEGISVSRVKQILSPPEKKAQKAENPLDRWVKNSKRNRPVK